MIGAKTAAEDVPTSDMMELVSDSRHVLNGLGGRFIKWKNEGYFLISNSLVTQITVARFRARTAITMLRWVKGHSGDPGNEGADRLARFASEKQDPDLPIDLTAPPELRMRGAKLKAMTQATAYKIIRKIKMGAETYQNKLDRRDTGDNVTLALAAAGERCQVEITREQLWISIRRRDFNRSAHFFLWMLLHDGYTVGRHWRHISGCEDRIECQVCNTEENMDHILTQCDAPGQNEVWNLAQRLWKQKTGLDLVITKGIIMSCGIQPPDTHKSLTKRGTERFRRLLVSESAHLIWKIRNDRVINERSNYTPREVEQRWLNAMNRRMRLDCTLPDKKKFRKKAIQISLVLKTWQGTLLQESSLPEDWTRENGVLVGIIT
ncbi:uncharacterized protein ARMOST_03982 [Armillaria ostoyae]|uniref:RNase H type-1 domain-containing protein n=1 Tax=Armillaria ostoyae TaxID=47428 RepID=A0A284QW50_ARMOS|nr:uncharacterized protein ARMOST_03982 [Armillaria ostoyae]